MFEPLLAVIAGFVALIWSADTFITGAASIARHWGMSKLLIGLTVVAFGTSAPEIMVSLSASLAHSGNLAVGNAIGSNIANVGLVLGMTALIAPIPVRSQLIKAELPILLMVMGLAGYVLIDQRLNLLDSLLLLAALAAFLLYLFQQQSHGDSLESSEESIDELSSLNLPKAIGYFIAGLVVLLGSAELLVWGAQHIARALGVSELFIGLTVIALGTSLPELATSAFSAMRGQHEIAFGNIIGSNIFNLLAVMAAPGLTGGTNLDDAVFYRDYFVMLLISMLWIIMMNIAVARGKAFSRPMGLLLLLGYAAYYSLLYQQH